MLVHHLLTVTAETPNCSASHLLVFWFSTRTTFSRLRGFSLIFIKLKSSANIIKVGDITKRILKKLHLYDCLRANKSLSAWGVEGRVPFLDKEFLDIAMRTNPAAKMCGLTPSPSPKGEGSFIIEKKIVREAFADLLPAEVAWRQKEQFSDGVGYSWIDTLKQITSEAVSDYYSSFACFTFSTFRGKW